MRKLRKKKLSKKGSIRKSKLERSKAVAIEKVEEVKIEDTYSYKDDFEDYEEDFENFEEEKEMEVESIQADVLVYPPESRREFAANDGLTASTIANCETANFELCFSSNSKVKYSVFLLKLLSGVVSNVHIDATTYCNSISHFTQTNTSLRNVKISTRDTPENLNSTSTLGKYFNEALEYYENPKNVYKTACKDQFKQTSKGFSLKVLQNLEKLIEIRGESKISSGLSSIIELESEVEKLNQSDKVVDLHTFTVAQENIGFCVCMKTDCKEFYVVLVSLDSQKILKRISMIEPVKHVSTCSVNKNVYLVQHLVCDSLILTNWKKQILAESERKFFNIDGYLLDDIRIISYYFIHQEQNCCILLSSNLDIYMCCVAIKPNSSYSLNCSILKVYSGIKLSPENVDNLKICNVNELGNEFIVCSDNEIHLYQILQELIELRDNLVVKQKDAIQSTQLLDLKRLTSASNEIENILLIIHNDNFSSLLIHYVSLKQGVSLSPLSYFRISYGALHDIHSSVYGNYVLVGDGVYQLRCASRDAIRVANLPDFSGSSKHRGFSLKGLTYICSNDCDISKLKLKLSKLMI